MLVVTSSLAGFLGLWLLGQSVLVMLLRRKLGVAIGNGSGKAPLLERAMRAQANTAEYMPMMLILMGLVEMRIGASWGAFWVLVGLALVEVVGRVCHALALVWTEPRGVKLGVNFRVVGMVGTWTPLGVLAGWVVAAAVM